MRKKTNLKFAVDSLNANPILEIALFCEKYNIFSFYLLCKYSRRYRFDWFRLLVNPHISILMSNYLKSRDLRKSKDAMPFPDYRAKRIP